MRRHSRSWAALLIGALLSACAGHATDTLPSPDGSQTQDYVKAHKLSNKIIRYASGGFTATLTPNYSTGFGTINYPCTPTCTTPAKAIPGPTASLKGGAVDFGSIEQGQDYLYKYAMQVSLTATSGWYLFANASSDFSSSLPASSLLWLASATANSTASLATPFDTTSTSNGWPYPIATGKTGSSTLDYDYILRVPYGTPNGSVSTQISYTVVPS
jgi:hypothetical protein